MAMTISHDDELLGMLRFQCEAGADEAVENSVSAAASIADAPVASAIAAPVAPPHTETPSGWLDDIDSLAGLEKACGEFTCDLRKTATQMVFARGNAASPLMVVGEAPGADEDRQGKPFVGASGQLLDKMLASIGIDESMVYITNILLWRPPGNRTPSAEEAAMFEPVIRKHIALAAPKMIFAVGGSAAKTLLRRSEGILKLRGRWHEYDNDGNPIPLLPGLHPSYLLRSPGQKQLAWQDLLMLKKRLDGDRLDGGRLDGDRLDETG